MKIYRKCVAYVALLILSMPLSVSAEALKLYAAGSLKAALDDVAASYERIYQAKITTKYGPSGILREAIERGDNADVFASADMIHPEKLASSGWGGPVVLFTRNQLCALAQPGIDIKTENLLDILMNKDIRVGTSTPKADPSGDYALELFKKADKVKQGNFETLSSKAVQLTGGPTSEKAPEGRNQYGWVMGEKKADVFITYCTNAVLARKEVQALNVIRIPEELSVGADYGLLVRNGASSEAWRFAMFILSSEGQKILAGYGFEAAALPKKE